MPPAKVSLVSSPGEVLDGPGILAVDDDSANLAALESALGDLGGHVVKAHSGRDALRQLLEQEFAVILLDVKMPGLDGFETARIIRGRERTRHLPIIFLTAYERESRDVQEAYALGAVDFLFKPLVPEILRAKVSVFVDLQQRTLEVKRQGERLREMERRQQEARIAEERKEWENDRLREESRRKDEFLAMLAHELRNPLSPMVTGIEILKLLGLPEEGQRRACDSMERQIRHLIRLVDDLLDISRISQGKIEIRREPFDLTEAVRQALESVRSLIDERRQDLVEEIHDGPLRVYGDRSRVIQLVSNLLTNANRYTPTEGRIELVLRREGDEVILDVTDDGQGIRAEMLDRVFDMFVQDHKGGQGLGLGLTLVKRIVDLHGGTVEVASEGIGRGARFTVTLPLVPAEEPEAAEEPKPVETGRFDRPLVIGVIEDNDEIRESTRVLLEQWGHEVHEAADGVSGIELVLEHRPQVALIDIEMPGIDGYEVARRIRDKLGDEPYLVAVTGYGQERDKKRAKRARFDSHLIKPVSATQLRETLREGKHGACEEEDGG